jgi:hypothetical protein
MAPIRVEINREDASTGAAMNVPWEGLSKLQVTLDVFH